MPNLRAGIGEEVEVEVASLCFPEFELVLFSGEKSDKSI